MIITYTKERGREEVKDPTECLGITLLQHNILNQNSQLAGGKQKKSTYHRLDGPAIEQDGHKAWYEDGMRHRVDGPAIEWLDGRRSWYIQGEDYTEEEFNNLIQVVRDMPEVLRLVDPRKWVREYK